MGTSAHVVLYCALLLPCYYFSDATQYDNLDSLGKAAKGRLGSLYSLRNKLARTPVVASSSSSGSDHNNNANQARRIYSPVAQKESRGYSFHHSSADITNPMFTQSYNTRDFHSRMGKVSDTSSKWKSPDKTMDKYIKYAYKMDGDSTSSWKDANSGRLNSFNIHQLDVKNNSLESKSKVKQILMSPLQSMSLPSSTKPTITTTTTTTTVSPPTKKSFNQFSTNGIDISPIKALGQGLNSAMTTVLTQKLMGIIDQEVPSGFLNPLKHLVSSGQKMVEFWDKRMDARDGKTPGIVEMFGYGIEQLKRYRDGQPMQLTDPIANLTSASKTMIQGMVVVKKLTNRVLGYDTDEAVVESRGGYDHGGWGWGGHHMSYGGLGGLDPFALLAALAFGAFLLQLLLTLLNTSARSLDVVDMNVPLMMSDYHVPNIMTRMDKIFGTPTIRSRRATEEDNPFFNSVIDKLDGVYKTYKTVSGHPSCAKLYLCRAAIQNRTGNESNILSQLYTIGLGQLSGDMASISLMKSIKSRLANGEDVDCEAEIKGCEE